MPAFLFACGCLVLLYGFLLSGDFDVDDVTVRGARLGDPRDVAASTGAFDQSIFEIEPASIANRLALLPYVESVSVETRLPSQVVVTLSERTPVLVWVTGQTSFLVDAHGKVMMQGTAPDLPGVESTGLELAPGGSIPAEQVAAVSAIQSEFGPQVDELTWNDRQGFVVRLDDKRMVILGEPERFPKKLAVYREFRATDAVWSVLDLREPDRPYYE